MTTTNAREMTALILQRWPGDGEQGSTADQNACPLDPAVVERVVDTAFESSLLQEEGRPVTLRLLVRSPAEFDAHCGPPEGLLRLIFTEPRPFTAGELRRLSPGASYHRSLIGVHVVSPDRLQVWGLLQSGPRWLQNSQGGRGPAPAFPDCLIVAVTGPGCLDVSRGSRLLLSVRAGRISPPSIDVFESQWLPRRFAAIREELRELHQQARQAQPKPWSKLDENVTRHIGQHMIKRLIATIRASRHGGTLVLLPRQYADDCVRGCRLNFKYRFVEDAASNRFRQLIVAMMNALAAMGADLRLPPDQPVGWNHLNEIHYGGLVSLEEGIFEISHLIAQLASVDGAIVLNKRFELLGFGAEIGGSLPDVQTVRRAVDVEADHYIEESVEEVGTRHRSAYRLCQAVPEALAIVVSQDGGVSFVCWKDDSVYYWPHEINAPTH